MTAWTEDGRPSEWVTEVETEFDANERDSWLALSEWRASICPDCGNPVVICSNPDGVFGEGFYLTGRRCWVRAREQVAQRTFDQNHKGAGPDGAGYLPSDGLVIRAVLENDGAEDPTARDSDSDPLAAILAQAKADLHEADED